MKPLSYIAAPYAAETPALLAWNVARAVLLARLVVSEGRAPVIVHPVIAPVFGPETPASRAIGIDCDCAIVSAVAARNGSEFVALLRDDDTCSSGMSDEYAAWCTVRRQMLRDLTRSTAPGVRAGNWRWWRQAFTRAGLLTEWAELLDAPWNAIAPLDTRIDPPNAAEVIAGIRRRFDPWPSPALVQQACREAGWDSEKAYVALALARAGGAR